MARPGPGNVAALACKMASVYNVCHGVTGPREDEGFPPTTNVQCPSSNPGKLASPAPAGQFSL
ncbi:hypothetical protein SBV1_1890011 [Verrucomicrobia bacterium]|nr:hypothetical protein SBV1_1890011 [Verrucomicrobiota bacterium]